MIGEIGGQLEADAAEWIKNLKFKNQLLDLSLVKLRQKVEQWGMLEQLLVVKMILLKAKKDILRKSGVNVVDSPANIGLEVKKILN